MAILRRLRKMQNAEAYRYNRWHRRGNAVASQIDSNVQGLPVAHLVLEFAYVRISLFSEAAFFLVPPFFTDMV